MIYIESMDFELNEQTTVCIGKFDGLHRGHRTLINYAALQKEKSVLFTFLMPDAKEVLYTKEEKRILAEELGIDIMIAIPFSKDIKQMPAKDFISKILIERCHASQVVVGEDFHFGYKRRGDALLLKNSLIKTIVFPKMTYENEPISSSRIRNEIQLGNIEKANIMLERPYFFSETVRRGNQIGRTLGMPTANLIVPSGKQTPPKGVYASRTKVNGKWYNGVTNIGVKPTIPGEAFVGAETFLFHFNEDIYGKTIQVELISFLRNEMKFNGLDELKKNMEQDCQSAKKALSHIIT